MEKRSNHHCGHHLNNLSKKVYSRDKQQTISKLPSNLAELFTGCLHAHWRQTGLNIKGAAIFSTLSSRKLTRYFLPV